MLIGHLHHLRQLIFELVVFLNIKSFPRCFFVEEVKKLTILRLRTHEILFGEDVVGEEDHAGGVRDEVGDGLHDVPGKHIPREVTQESALQGQVGKPHPTQKRCSSLRLLCHLDPHLLQRLQLLGVAPVGPAAHCV